MSRVAVIGLGLIGGSLARDLVARGARVLGHDRSPATLAAAAAAGIAPLASLRDPELAEAELLVLAVPVDVAAALLVELAPRLAPGCVVTDLGSTKRSIVRAAEAAGIAERFVGSHPLAGDHRSGWEAGRAGLFADARVFLSPTGATGTAALERVRTLWRELGARVEELSAAEHDRQLAWTSHLPQVAASALAAALDDAGWRPDQLGPGGRDATRLAASSPEIWSAIAADNADLLAVALASLESRIADFRRALERGDLEALHPLFDLAHRWARRPPPAP